MRFSAGVFYLLSPKDLYGHIELVVAFLVVKRMSFKKKKEYDYAARMA